MPGRIVGLTKDDSGIGSLLASGRGAMDGAVYTLAGVRVSQDSLRKGVYIRNGRKFIVR